MFTNQIDTDDAQLLYKNNPITKLAGTSLDAIDRISFTIAPDKINVDTEDEMFIISLEYDGVLMNEVKLFWYQDAPRDAWGAVFKNDVYTFREFINKQGPFASQDGFTFLHAAAQLGDVEVMQELIQAGLDVNALGGPLNETPLHHATYAGHLEVAKLLLQKGAQVNVTNSIWNETPIFDVIKGGSVNLVKLLLEYGADKNISNKKGETPASLALQSTNEEIKNCLMVTRLHPAPLFSHNT